MGDTAQSQYHAKKPGPIYFNVVKRAVKENDHFPFGVGDGNGWEESFETLR